MKKIISIIGARPQFIKVAPFIQALRKNGSVQHIILHTGQHYDYRMSKVFFDELGIPAPKYNLGVGSGSHGQQTGEMLRKIEPILLKEKPDWIVVFGDTNSTLAGTLAAAKLHIPTAHIEAGLRSFNKKMPEEINRIVTDHSSQLLFCPSQLAVENLKRENIPIIVNNGRSIRTVPRITLNWTDASAAAVNAGDVMFDTLRMCLKIARTRSRILSTLNLTAKNYYLATIHRPENTDTPRNLDKIVKALITLSKRTVVVWPIHPRTYKFLPQIHSAPNLKIIEPVGYFDMLTLEKNARKILTDSGGIQKEAYWLKVPCVTLRQQTEWKETLAGNCNIVAGIEVEKILREAQKKIPQLNRHFNKNYYGDGHAAQKIVSVLLKTKINP